MGRGNGGRSRGRDAALLSGLRFVEPPLGTTRLATATLVVASRAVLLGSGAGFLLALGLWITLEEGLPDVWRTLDLDPVSRFGLVVTSVVAAAAAVLFALGLSAERALLVRRLARTAREAPNDVPPMTLRRAAVERDAVSPLLVLSRVLIGVAVTVGVVDLFLWSETDDLAASTITLGAAVFPTGGLLVLNGVLRRRRAERMSGALAPVLSAWPRNVVERTNEAERARRSRGRREPEYGPSHARLGRLRRPMLAASGVAIAAGAGIHFLGIAIRQPGRRADPVHYGPTGELTIDTLTWVGAIVVGAGLLGLLAGLSITTVVRTLERAVLRRQARAEGGFGPAVRVVQRELGTVSPVRAVGAFLVGSVTVVAEPVIATLVIASEPAHALHPVVDGVRITLVVLVVLAALGVGLIAAGEWRGRAFRQLLRDRWHPGDDARAPEPAPSRRSGRGSPSDLASTGGWMDDRREGTGDGGGGSDGGGGDGGGGDGGGDGGGGGGGGGD